MKLIIDIPRKVNEHIRSWYGHGYFPQNKEDRNIIAKAIYDSTPIPDNATVCDKACFVSVGEKEPDEISEEVTLRFFKNSLKVRWQDFVIYNVEWLKKNWQMEMDIVCGVKPCDDAVSREAVLEIAKQHTLTNDYLSIQNLPSVRPQEPRGSDEISERNMKMWQDIFEEEKRRAE